MDDNKFMESEGPVAPPVKSKIHHHAVKQEMKCVQPLDVAKMSAEDTNCNVTIMLSPQKLSSEEEGRRSPSCQLTSHIKDKLNLKSGQCMNGIVNGLPLSGVDVSRSDDLENGDPLSNGEAVTATSEPPASHCGNCESGCHESGKVNPKPVTNCLNDVSDDGRDSCSEKRKEDGLSTVAVELGSGDVEYVSYKSELQMPDIMRLIQKDLSEPYLYTPTDTSFTTGQNFVSWIRNWTNLVYTLAYLFLVLILVRVMKKRKYTAMDGSSCIGAIVCKLDVHRKVVKRGYIAMLAVDEKYRKKKIGSNLVLKAIRAMVEDDADEVVLETEITNRPALRLYENLGFVRDKRLFRYYLNGVDALRLKLWLR